MSEERKLYEARDIEDLAQFYVDHVVAMTAEGLHAKSDIAAELAWRDQRIAELEEHLKDAEAQISDMDDALWAWSEHTCGDVT